jgi:hypothetical protein
LAQKSGLLFDLSMDVLVPPLSRVVGLAVVGSIASSALLVFTGHGALAASAFGFALFGVGLYGFAGWLHSGTGLRGLLDLAFAPAYVAWKIALSLQGSKKKSNEWVRTTREGEKSP